MQSTFSLQHGIRSEAKMYNSTLSLSNVCELPIDSSVNFDFSIDFGYCPNVSICTAFILILFVYGECGKQFM